MTVNSLSEMHSFGATLSYLNREHAYIFPQTPVSLALKRMGASIPSILSSLRTYYKLVISQLFIALDLEDEICANK
jgi:hypothetical protein